MAWQTTPNRVGADICICICLCRLWLCCAASVLYIGRLLHGCCLDLEPVLLVFCCKRPRIAHCSCTCRCVQPWGSLAPELAKGRDVALASVVPLHLDTASKVTIGLYSRGHYKHLAGRLCCLRQVHVHILYKEPVRRSAVSRLEGSLFAVSGFAVRCLWAK